MKRASTLYYARVPAVRPGNPNRPEPPRGHSACGRISTISRGQGYGYIRLPDGRRIFFHRGDSQGGIFNELVEGDAVSFDLLEDRVSGPRALTVRRQTRAGKSA
jgi:cold shock CspA family protein